jgi:hypothetical protein
MKKLEETKVFYQYCFLLLFEGSFVAKQKIMILV